MPKNAYFWKNTVKSPQRRGIRPRTPVGLRQLGLHLRTPALLLSPSGKTEVTHSKCFGLVSSVLLCLLFTSNFAVFVGGERKNIFDSGRLVPLVTPLIRLSG